MIRPEDPESLRFHAVVSIYGRIGLILKFGKDSQRPYVQWEHSTIPVIAEWHNIDLIKNHAQIQQAIESHKENAYFLRNSERL